jgi:LacI family transcriptional regulator
MSEVAKRAGAGMASVSRVLSGHPDVSETMRARVLLAVAELGYEPNLLAQGLRRHETSTVGFMLSDIANPLLAGIVQGAESILRQAGYSMLLTDSERDSRLDVEHLRVLRQRRVDGLIVMPASESDAETLGLLDAGETPLVVIDRELPDTITAGYVLSDHAAGTVAAAQHLWELGHRRFGLLSGPPVHPNRVRENVMTQFVEGRGPDARLSVRSGRTSPDHATETTIELLDSADPPTAFLLGSNQLLPGVLREVHARQLELGRDLSLVTVDDTPLSELHVPAISVIDRDTRLIGREAAEMLLRLVRRGEAPETVRIPTRYDIRQSCGRPRR